MPSAGWMGPVESDGPTLGEAVPAAESPELGASVDNVGWEGCGVAGTSGVG